MKQVTEVIPAPADLGIEVIGVPQDSGIELDLKLEAVTEGVLVTGTARAELRGNCVRCLGGIEEEASFEVQELFFYPGREQEEDDLTIVDEMIDLEEVLRDAVVLELPFAPLCDEGCLGLCPQCGFNRNDDSEHTHAEPIDPRWEKLAGLTGDTQD